ncbi:MAG: hypothetical protein JRF63_10875, partial [Deltaproteobacteria bacterium]|nr:hypothetical protein [Deltaproteobacteria bacterium]
MRTSYGRQWKRARVALLAGLVLCSAVLVSACCVDGWIRLGRIKGFLSGVFELTV